MTCLIWLIKTIFAWMLVELIVRKYRSFMEEIFRKHLSDSTGATLRTGAELSFNEPVRPVHRFLAISQVIKIVEFSDTEYDIRLL